MREKIDELLDRYDFKINSDQTPEELEEIYNEFEQRGLKVTESLLIAYRQRN
tara:strand:- start:8609 stop:8764 length:156 start_codon:yes stop_codon:yes gene_type:complete